MEGLGSSQNVMRADGQHVPLGLEMPYWAAYTHTRTDRTRQKAVERPSRVWGRSAGLGKQPASLYGGGASTRESAILFTVFLDPRDEMQQLKMIVLRALEDGHHQPQLGEEMRALRGPVRLMC